MIDVILSVLHFVGVTVAILVVSGVLTALLLFYGPESHASRVAREKREFVDRTRGCGE